MKPFVLLFLCLLGTSVLDPTNAFAAEQGEHAASGEQGAHGGGHHTPHFSDINWFTGFLGEKEGVEPSLLWRPVGTPVPLGALFLNTAILFFLIGRFGGPGIRSGLKSRKQRIAGEIERAAAMKAEAEGQLAHYEGKLAEMQSEMERIKKEMAAQAQNEREALLDAARRRATDVEAEARLMVRQQLAHARDEATKKAVAGAVAAARAEIQKHMTAQDQDRLARDLVAGMDQHFRAKEAQS